MRYVALLRFVIIANIAGSVAPAATGLFAGTVMPALGAAALSIDVAAFAASQSISMRRMRLA